MILEEYDSNERAILNPDSIHTKIEGFPETVIAVFSRHLFRELTLRLECEMFTENRDVDGIWPIYKVTYKGETFGFTKGRQGAPACVGHFEDIIAMGAKRIILLGSCGALDASIDDCEVILPTGAIRDEGTSYHYVPASDFIPVNEKYRDIFQEICKENNFSYKEGYTWTTDAFYRETTMLVERRKKAGAVCVEMECAGMQAMCCFRNVEFFQYLYAADSLCTTEWNPRSLSGGAKLELKRRIAMIAFELAYRIEKCNRTEQQ